MESVPATTETRYRVMVIQNEGEEPIPKEIRGSNLEILRQDLGIIDPDVAIYIFIDTLKPFVKLKGKKELG